MSLLNVNEATKEQLDGVDLGPVDAGGGQVRLLQHAPKPIGDVQ